MISFVCYIILTIKWKKYELKEKDDIFIRTNKYLSSKKKKIFKHYI